MSDPVRWIASEGSSLDVERALLRAATSVDPPEGEQDRVWAAVLASLGAAPGAPLGGDTEGAPHGGLEGQGGAEGLPHGAGGDPGAPLPGNIGADAAASAGNGSAVSAAKAAAAAAAKTTTAAQGASGAAQATAAVQGAIGAAQATTAVQGAIGAAQATTAAQGASGAAQATTAAAKVVAAIKVTTAAGGGVAATAGAAGVVKSMLIGAASAALFLGGAGVMAPLISPPQHEAASGAQASALAAGPASARTAPSFERSSKRTAPTSEQPPADAPRPVTGPAPGEAPLARTPAPGEAFVARAPAPGEGPSTRKPAPGKARTSLAPPAPAPQRAPAPAPRPRQEDAASVTPGAAPTPASGDASGVGVPSSPAAGRESRLREELTLLGEARDAIRRGDAPRALAILEHARLRFPGGALAQEREALAIEALWHSGHRAAAAQRAAAFLATHPSSPHAARLQAFTR